MAKKLPSKKVARLLLLNNERKVLLVRQASRMQWQLPGGKMALGEKPKNTVLREVIEETQIRCSGVKRIYIEHIQWPDHLETIYCFVGTATDTTKMCPDGKEIDALSWVSLPNIYRFKLTETTTSLLQKVAIINLFV